VVQTPAPTEATKPASCDSAAEFQCANFAATKQCIPIARKCDDVPDCADRSDEGLFCPKPATAAPKEPCDINTQFECKNKQCIMKHLWCDQKPDCVDGSDEVVCPVAPTDTAPVEIASKNNESSSDSAIVALVVLVVLMLVAVVGFAGFRAYGIAQKNDGTGFCSA
jgi:hypothetical protein